MMNTKIDFLGVLDILSPDILNKMAYKVVQELPLEDTLVSKDIGTMLFKEDNGTLRQYVILKTDKIKVFEISTKTTGGETTGSGVNVVVLNSIPGDINGYDNGTFIIAGKEACMIYTDTDDIKKKFMISKNESVKPSEVEIPLISYQEMMQYFKEV